MPNAGNPSQAWCHAESHAEVVEERYEKRLVRRIHPIRDRIPFCRGAFAPIIYSPHQLCSPPRSPSLPALAWARNTQSGDGRVSDPCAGRGPSAGPSRGGSDTGTWQRPGGRRPCAHHRGAVGWKKGRASKPASGRPPQAGSARAISSSSKQKSRQAGAAHMGLSDGFGVRLSEHPTTVVWHVGRMRGHALGETDCACIGACSCP